VFQIEGQGTVAKATHPGIPWLRFLRRRLAQALHPELPANERAVAQVEGWILGVG